MSTDVRVVKHKDKNGDFYKLHRCYYASQGSLESIDEAEFSPYGETTSELRAETALASRAFDKPVVQARK